MIPKLSDLDIVNFNPVKEIQDIQVCFYLINDYEHFVSIIEGQISRAFRHMETNPKFLYEKSEDEITDVLRIALQMAGVPAEHDSMEGGHADVVIKSLHYKWIAEAKVKDDRGYDWLWEGFMQLTERYATNTAGCNKSGFLVYVKQRNCRMAMERWRAFLQKVDEYDFTFVERDSFDFGSSHIHTRMGTNCDVSHLCLSIYHDPVV